VGHIHIDGLRGKGEGGSGGGASRKKTQITEPAPHRHTRSSHSDSQVELALNKYQPPPHLIQPLLQLLSAGGVPQAGGRAAAGGHQLRPGEGLVAVEQAGGCSTRIGGPCLLAKAHGLCCTHLPAPQPLWRPLVLHKILQRRYRVVQGTAACRAAAAGLHVPGGWVGDGRRKSYCISSPQQAGKGPI